MLLVAQIVALTVLILTGLFLGRRMGRLKNAAWIAGFLIPLLAIGLVIVGHRSVRLSFVPPFSWAIDPWIGPLLMALAVPMMLSTLIVRLPRKSTRIMVGILLAVMTAYYALLPVAVPLFVRSSLAGMRTEIGAGGVCRQGHVYTCGPAAAVTCLRVLHVPADEGPLAIEAQSGPAIGTDPILLARAINTLYGDAGLHCEYRYVRDIDALTLPAIANIFSPQYGGHYIAVLEVTPKYILVGDPLRDYREKWSREEFLAEWTGAAHEFSGVPPHAAPPLSSPTAAP